MNDKTKHETKRPLFIVGTTQEVGHAIKAGHEAATIQGMDSKGITALALDLAENGRTAIIILGQGYVFEDACIKAGAYWHAVTQER